MNAIKILVLSAILSLAACDSTTTVESIKPTRDTKDFTVRLNVVPQNQITEKCNALGNAYDANGCNAFHTPENFCDIYVVMPDNVNDSKRLEIMGHELLHCRYGAYHK
jgi:hypothetical protein